MNDKVTVKVNGEFDKEYVKRIFGEINELKLDDIVAIEYELSYDKKGLLKWSKFKDGHNNFYYHIYSDEMNSFEQGIYKELTNGLDNKPELKYYTWGFECPDINNLITKEQKDEIYNKILNSFQEQLKEWIYK